jgi:nitrogenase molybdenum-iron protein alpha/beta subunit
MRKLSTILCVIVISINGRADSMAQSTPTPSSCPQLQLTLEACDKALRATEAELEARKEQSKLLADYAAKVEAQRDEAYKRAESGKSILPGWAWAVLGAAGATIILGVRR